MDDLLEDVVFDFLVIIPAYKAETVGAAIASVVRQNGVTKQILVVDDHPLYQSATVAAAFPEVLYVKNPTPTGGWPGRVRNFGFQVALEQSLKASFVHFLDDDDIAPEGHYAFIKQTFEVHPDVGLVFGVMRPFAIPRNDVEQQQQQELQLKAVRDWRLYATRYPWFYQHVADVQPTVGQWMFYLHALFGQEMFLCAGGVVRFEHVVTLGGFPDHIRITQGYYFFTKVIRSHGCRFIERVTADYGVGDATSIWNPPKLDDSMALALRNEWGAELSVRHRDIRGEVGGVEYLFYKVCAKLQRLVVNQVIGCLDRLDYFSDLRRLIG